MNGLKLDTDLWQVRPLAVGSVESSFYDGHGQFPPGSIQPDHALIMQDIPHRWHSLPDIRAGRAA